ncbi:DNA primase [Candidatus Pacearchaeota archaeon]|nr:DNA primase [Candidatus Pacearchaeota archaeon]
MAKISPVSIKYNIIAHFEADGVLEKPDIIGAVFGQTEGLLGSDLEMRELQKEGKIGRVEVTLKTEDGKTKGTIEVPSALDKAETTIIAAALETIERIGPSNAKIEIEKIEDVRSNKRAYIVDRAKRLLEVMEKNVPESREMKENVRISTRMTKLHEYGEEKLPAGDLSSDEIIVVEGRADVINLIKNGINNVIAMDGTILPKTIQELSREKKITLFVDGDRGGKLIVKNVTANADIDYIAIAPDGKEVEELSAKEMLACLRKRFPARQRLNNEIEKVVEHENNKEITPEDKEKLKHLLEQVEGKRKALLLDHDLNIIREVSTRNISAALSKMINKVFAMVMDGIAIMPMINAAEKANCKYIVAKSFSQITEEINVKLLSL